MDNIPHDFFPFHAYRIWNEVNKVTLQVINRANLVIEGKQVVIEQDGRKGRPIVL